MLRDNSIVLKIKMFARAGWCIPGRVGSGDPRGCNAVCADSVAMSCIGDHDF